MSNENENDDLEAVRKIITALQPFKAEDRERIIRWAREKLGMSHVATPLTATAPFRTEPVEVERPPNINAATGLVDIKTFADSKQPQSDSQFAALVAYYYRFVAPASERKETITADDLQEAFRLAQRPRPNRASGTLTNTKNAGYLDSIGQGAYRINAVGENLVAMALPSGSAKVASHKIKRRVRPSAKGRKTSS